MTAPAFSFRMQGCLQLVGTTVHSVKETSTLGASAVIATEALAYGDSSCLVCELDQVRTVSTLDGGGGTNTREVENGVVSDPLVESPLLGYEKPKICHEGGREQKLAPE